MPTSVRGPQRRSFRGRSAETTMKAAAIGSRVSAPITGLRCASPWVARAKTNMNPPKVVPAANVALLADRLLTWSARFPDAGHA